LPSVFGFGKTKMMLILFKQYHSRILAFILGLTSVIGQVLLLRELVTVFYGNETAYAVILASWLFWVSVGSLLSGYIVSRVSRPAVIISMLYLLTALFLPATIIVTRFIKIILGSQTGEIIGLFPMCVSAYLLLAPLTILLGALFTFICRFNENGESPASGAYAVSTVYIWESVGAAVGGFLLSFILLHFFDALMLAVMITIVDLSTILFLSEPRSWAFKLGVVSILFFVLFSVTGMVGQLDFLTRQQQWRGLKVLATTDSIYGNLVLTQVGPDYSLYENGLLSFTTRDDQTSEEDVHFPMSQHPDPRKILLIGNGLGGALREVLKYPHVRVDYVELDPEVVRLSQKHLDQKYLHVLNDERVRMIHTDGRWLIKRNEEKYDVLIINLGDPYTAMINRYYTKEFFQETSRILSADGILSMSVTSSANYLNEETRDFLRSLHTTLRTVFPEVRSIPGDSNIFLVSQRPGVLTLDVQVIMQRLKDRSIQTQYVREYNLPYRLSPDRIREIDRILEQPGQLNTDAHPIAYLYDIILWSTHFDDRLSGVMKKLQAVKAGHILIILPLLILMAGAAITKVRPTFPVTLSIMATGFSEIIFQVLVILAFQTLYGYAYYRIGLIIASFMAGLVGGSLLARRLLAIRYPTIRNVYLLAQGAICGYPLLIPWVFVAFRDSQRLQQFPQVFAVTFGLLPVIAGFLGGLQYPLAVKIVNDYKSKATGKVTQIAGLLYGLDIFGATVGALIAGTVLIPLFGITTLAYICAVINATVLVLLGVREKRKNPV
jgi:spermidine synthase